MWENRRPFLSRWVQFSSTFVWLWCVCCLVWGININFVAVTRQPAVFSRSILRTLLIQCWTGEFLSYHLHTARKMIIITSVK
jgi:hypothetical protein